MIEQVPITEITPIWREIQITLRIQCAAFSVTRLDSAFSYESCYSFMTMYHFGMLVHMQFCVSVSKEKKTTIQRVFFAIVSEIPQTHCSNTFWPVRSERITGATWLLSHTHHSKQPTTETMNVFTVAESGYFVCFQNQL